MDRKSGLAAVEEELAILAAGSDGAAPAVGQKNGLYFLPGREEIITTRQKRYNYSNRKLKIARRFAAALRIFSERPCDLSGQHHWRDNLRDESDIDFFIITKPGRLWLSRLYCAGLTKLLGHRPTATEKRIKFV